jgi:hypothetical protein
VSVSTMCQHRLLPQNGTCPNMPKQITTRCRRRDDAIFDDATTIITTRCLAVMTKSSSKVVTGRFPTLQSITGRWLSYRKANSKTVQLYARQKFPEWTGAQVTRYLAITTAILYVPEKFCLWADLLQSGNVLAFISRYHYIFLLVVCFLHVLKSSVTFCSRKSPLLVFLSVISVRSLSHKVSPTCCVACTYYLLISCHFLIAVHSGTILPCLISVVK